MPTRTKAATLASTLLLLSACAGPSAHHDRKAHLASQTHVVSENPGDCPICALYENRRDAVVFIRTDSGLGTGVVIDPHGTILTNAHVIENARTITVQTFDGTVFPASITRTQPEVDLATITVIAPETRWTSIRPDDAATPVIGSAVYVIGHPVGLGWTLTEGILSGAGRMSRANSSQLFQITAAVSPGNSGGPAFDVQGRWIGTVTSKLIGPGLENISFVIPAAELQSFLRAE